tara:strand:- start:788 stop:2761 length:1974 start_codon:yes stop_codon:yes gene_type:complete
MIEKDYTLKITTADAEANLKQLNSTLEEQREILIMLEKDLLKVQETQRKTSKTNLEAQRRLTKQADHLKDAIKDQRLGLRTLNTERRAASSAITELNKGSKEQTNIVRGIDKLTGGYATKVIKLKKAFFSSIKVLKGFATGLKGIQKALVATGIGAIAVGIGLIVAYWDDIKGLVNGVSVEQQSLLDTTQKTLDTQEEQLKTTSSMENTLKLQGKSEKEIRDLKRQQTDEIIASSELLLEQQKQQKKSQIEAAERNQKITAGIIGFLSLPITMLLGAVDALTYGLEKVGLLDEATSLTEGFTMGIASLVFDPKDVEEEADKTIEATEKKILELKNKRDGFILADKKDKEKTTKENNDAEIKAEKEKADALERIRQGLIDTEAERRAEKLREIQQDYDEQIALAEKYYGEESEKVKELKEAQRIALKTQQDAFDLEDAEKQAKIDEEKEKKRLKGIADAKKVADALAELEKKKREEQLATFDNLVAIGGAETKFGQAMLIAKQLLLAKELIMDVKATLFAAKTSATKTVIKSAEAGVDVASGAAKAAAAAPFPGNIPLIVGYAAQAVGIVSAIKSAVKASKQATKGIGGGGGGDISAPSIDGGSVPPAFNIVGASGESQLADAIGGQSQRPSRSYVVASDVSTAQELDRNIIEGASIG